MNDCSERLCRKRVNPGGNPLSQHETCRPAVNHDGPKYVGFAVWSTCPRNWTDDIVRRKCQRGNQSNLFNDWPVFDRDRRITYKNVFCARCNGAVNTTYWKLEANCRKWFNTTAFNLSGFMRFAQFNCSVKIRKTWGQYLRQCIPRFQDCSGIGREKNGSYCQSQCLGYAFPVNFMNLIRFRNLQCALCNGFQPSYLGIDLKPNNENPIPQLTILFDFTSSFENRVTVKDRKMHFERNISHFCALDEVYDLYVGKCKSIVSLQRSHVFQNEQTAPVDFISNETRLFLNLNCTFVPFNQSDYEQRPNGTVYITPHHMIYGKTRYTIRGNILLVCVNFSRNVTVVTVERTTGYLTKTVATSLQIVTFAGCITSMASLLFMLAKYTLFSELRNLPGRIIFNLSLSLLLYQGVFLAAMKTSSHEQCQVIAILLHYFVLCSFTWMNAMAFDVHKAFTSSDGGLGSNRQGNHNKRLVEYCLYGWGVPAILVSFFVIIDQILIKGFIGYGEGKAYCYISKPKAVLYFVVAPIALIMLFNAFALVHTVLHIVKTRKRTPKGTNQRNSTEVALICVKMASVTGVTWILGIAANVQALSFLWYPYVVLNSLQGLFIFLSFAASRRSLELYRAKIAILRNRCSRNAARNTSRTKDKIVVTRSGKSWSPDVQDCEEAPL
ncbi:adhesion G-protein coupled receptor D1-like [Montipora capricornis]|uniref:adhesion G-protein coupled receptor D1-like n=1 Tax=Montipora capricornis TaxID=246305 RepID=UPI0035F13888